MALGKIDKQHIKNISSYETQIKKIYESAATEAAKIGVSIHSFNPNKKFKFADYPTTKKKINALFKGMSADIEAVILNGIDAEWTLSNDKNNELSQRVFGDNVGKLTDEQYKQYFSNNSDALEAFKIRKLNGLSLSEKVWNYTKGFKTEIEMGLEVGLREGKSATAMATDLKKYLKYPDKLFRRVKDSRGKYHLSMAAKDFHPGQGAYRSSYKNALRLARTETNMAYRKADYLRWQDMDFVVGVRINLSRSHPVYDMCDDLAGDYPKDYNFIGWHAQCLCHATTILKTQEELDEDMAKIVEGKTLDGESANRISKVPHNYTKWINKNKERINKSKNLPYFIKDNYIDGDIGKGLKF